MTAWEHNSIQLNSTLLRIRPASPENEKYLSFTTEAVLLLLIIIVR